MKLGVFGDSYADEMIHVDIARYPSWITLLRNNYEVESHGLGGSGLYYSFKLFLENYPKYDKIIFVATVPGRIHIPEWIEFTNKYTRHVNSYDVAKLHLKIKGLSGTAKLALGAAMQYYMYLIDEEKERIIHGLMVEKVKQLRPDALILTTDGQPNSLTNINRHEIKSVGFPDEAISWNDKRVCHFSKRTNEFLAEKMLKWLNGEPPELNLEEWPKITKEEIANLLYK